MVSVAGLRFAFGWYRTIDLTEGVTVSDSVFKFVMKSVAESLGVGDVRNVDVSTLKEEIINLLESRNISVDRSLVESLSVADAVYLAGLFTTLEENVTLSDSIGFVRTFSKVLSEVITLSDEVSTRLGIHYQQLLNETISLSEFIETTKGVIFSKFDKTLKGYLYGR